MATNLYPIYTTSLVIESISFFFFCRYESFISFNYSFTYLFQVSRRSHQSSPTKATVSQEIPASVHSTKESTLDDSEHEEKAVSSVQETPENQQNLPVSLQARLSANSLENSSSTTQSDSSLPLQKRTFKKPAGSSKRLLAPSFFSTKS